MLLQEKAGAVSDKQRKMLEEAERSCGRMTALVQEMSDLGKLEAQTLAIARQDLELGGLMADLASHMHEGHDRGVRLEVRGGDQPIVVTGDRTRLSAAISALLRAALRERGDPGIVVAALSVAEDGRAAWALVAVGDSGMIPSLTESWHAPPAFDEWRGGLGFALPLARRIIEAHGGALWSAPGADTRAGSALRLPVRG